MILFKEEAIFASSISKFEKFFPETDREDFKSSSESTISTPLIHNMASDGNFRTSGQLDSWILSSIIRRNVE